MHYYSDLSELFSHISFLTFITFLDFIPFRYTLAFLNFTFLLEILRMGESPTKVRASVLRA